MSEVSKPVAERMSPEKVVSNTALHNNIRSLVALFAGSVCGIIGLDGIYGVVFFLLAMAALSACLLVKVNFQPALYFPTPSAIWTDGVFAAMMTYVLFWTMLYNIVHVY